VGRVASPDQSSSHQKLSPLATCIDSIRVHPWPDLSFVGALPFSFVAARLSPGPEGVLRKLVLINPLPIKNLAH
jgi:hypothetical protein